MLLSHAHRFIYTKTVKTAGTSVEIYFENACLPKGEHTAGAHHIPQTVTPAGVIGYRGNNPIGCTWYNHMPAQVIRELIGRSTWEQYFRFCVVRNPFDKMVSLWWFIRSKQPEVCRSLDFPSVQAAFSQWCVAHAPLAVDRDKYVVDGRMAMDFVIRYEDLLNGLASVCRRIDYPFDPARLGNFKSEARLLPQSFQYYYDQPAIAAVEAAFSWELDHFGYHRLSGH